MTNKRVFVTVGTTQFDKLIQTVMDKNVLKELNDKGYNEITLQTGASETIPDCTPRCGFKAISHFSFAPSLNSHIDSADLVISHAGAGTCMEVLTAKKDLIVVVNDLLMDNHQTELAEQLHKDGYLFYCTCDTLRDFIANMDLSKLKKDFRDKSHLVAKMIDQIMGFSP